VSPSRKSTGRGGEEEPRDDETQEYELGEDSLEDVDDEEELDEEELGEEELAEDELPEDVDPEELGDEDLDEDHEDQEDELPEEDELERVVSAETQEWEGLEAAEAEAEADHPTLVASAGRRVKQAGSAITSSFEKVGGKKVTDGFKAVGGKGIKRIRRWRPGFPLWLRFLTASFVIIASIAAATSASLILYLEDIANALEDNTIGEKVDKFLTNVDGGGPQTILILGSDKDPELKDVQKGFKGLSDTTMLIRLDPDRGAISLFSLPRDLKVQIPGLGTDKLNAAYAYGGPQLTLQTVESLLSFPGQPFEVNHLVNVDFEGFARAVNAIDCVYVDVDRRYFNSNEGKADIDAYEEIDIQPGYQALCGFDALDFARYRHTDNDIVRAARQQEFLREARAKIPPSRLIGDRKQLISIFTEHTTSDINDSQTMLQVLRLFLDSRDKPVKEVRFEGSLGPSFVTASTQQLRIAVSQFLGIQGTPGTAGKTAAPDRPVEADVPPDQTPVPPAASRKPKKKSPVKEDGSSTSLTPTSYGKQLAKGIRRRGAKIPILYPTVLQTGTDYAQKPRVYKINGTGEGSPPRGERAAYKWVFSRPALGEYYGFMATRWTDPPILDDPDDEKTIKGRDYKLYYENDRLRLIGWQTDEGAFWLTNTLIESLSNNEMLRIAEGFRELGGGR
jgi:polyisoprenyl-teichoic acid--peptidoglycan teichoic acid transferase